MIRNRIVKWSAAAVLAAGTIPALSLAKSHVSLPTNNITVTPTSASAAMEAPVTATSSHVTHAKVKKASARRHSSKHHRGTSAHHKKGTSASLKRHSSAARARKTSSSKSAGRTIRVD